MSMGKETMGRASKNHIEAYTRGCATRASWAVATVGGGNLFLPNLAWLISLPNRRVLVRERGFLVLTGMPSPVLGESYTTYIKDFAIFPPHKKK